MKKLRYSFYFFVSSPIPIQPLEKQKNQNQFFFIGTLSWDEATL
jgi:hypothetical protein